jgi:hypothetical protein
MKASAANRFVILAILVLPPSVSGFLRAQAANATLSARLRTPREQSCPTP